MNRPECPISRGDHVLRSYLSIKIALRECAQAVFQAFRIVAKRWLRQVSDLETSMRCECLVEVFTRFWMLAQVVLCSEVTLLQRAKVPALAVSSKWYSDMAYADSARTATAFARAGMFARESAMASRQS
jgi:hypothetical protein